VASPWGACASFGTSIPQLDAAVFGRVARIPAPHLIDERRMTPAGRLVWLLLSPLLVQGCPGASRRLRRGERIVHELSICEGIIEVASATLGEFPRPAPRVATVTVRIGRLTGVVADSLRYYFELLSPGTPLSGAGLVIEPVPIRGRCADCAAEFVIEVLSFTCPACGSGFVELLSGRELQVVALETAEEVPCGS
jgi:hydrogenase nickel incorporation protein HypA/HybF